MLSWFLGYGPLLRRMSLSIGTCGDRDSSPCDTKRQRNKKGPIYSPNAYYDPCPPTRPNPLKFPLLPNKSIRLWAYWINPLMRSEPSNCWNFYSYFCSTNGLVEDIYNWIVFTQLQGWHLCLHCAQHVGICLLRPVLLEPLGFFCLFFGVCVCVCFVCFFFPDSHVKDCFLLVWEVAEPDGV